MKYEESTFILKLIEDLEGEMTHFDNRVYEFDDCDMKVSGFVQQTFAYEPQGYYTPPSWELTSRSANLDIWEITERERLLTPEEIYFIEHQIERV